MCDAHQIIKGKRKSKTGKPCMIIPWMKSQVKNASRMEIFHVGRQCSMREKSSHGMVMFQQDGKEEAGHDKYLEEDSTETTIF